MAGVNCIALSLIGAALFFKGGPAWMKFGANKMESRRKALANTENLSVRITITTSYSKLS
jgi:hypothetical protein